MDEGRFSRCYSENVKSPTQSVMVQPQPVPWSGTAAAGGRPSPAMVTSGTEADLLMKLAFAFFALDLFLSISRLLEIIALAASIRVPYLGVTIHLVTLALALISGGARRVIATRIGAWVALFTAWMLVCTLTSTWRGGSVDTLVREWVPSLIIFVGCGTVVTLRQCRTVCIVLAGASSLIAVASYSLASLREDRLSFETGTLGGANELSMLLVLGVPFVLLPMFSPRASRFLKLIALALCAMALVVVVRSASRSSLLALVAITLILFWTLPFAAKIKLALLTLVALAAFVTLTPRQVLSRYSTLFNDARSDDDVATSAQASSEAREYLLQQSLRLSMEHPLFGLGPGVFVVGEAKLAAAEGQKAAWHVSHNSYTQVSSEMGIPGFLLYLAALVTTFSNVFWFRSRSRIDVTGKASAMGLALLLSLVGLCINLGFSSNAYFPYLPMFMGLSVVFRKGLEREMGQRSPVLNVPEPPRAAALQPVAASSSKPVYRFLGRPRRSGA